jgi:hypothetical protein
MGMAERHAEHEYARGFTSSERTICPDHVDDPTLKQSIKGSLAETTCSFCAKTGTESAPVAAEFDTFMAAFMRGVRSQYVQANEDGVPLDDGEYLVSPSSSDEAAEELFWEALFDHPSEHHYEVLEEVKAVMFPDDWVPVYWQWMSPAEQLIYSWDEFKEEVKYQTRFLFFSDRDADERYNPERLSAQSLFNKLSSMLTKIPNVYRVLPAGSRLLRGRMVATPPDCSKYSAKELGSPPREKASANRMSPAGISMFYGASDLDTVIAEIGAHSPFGHAVTGEFQTTQELDVIDLSRLPGLPSPFDTENAKLYHLIKFLESFVTDLTLPIDLDGREHIDYVPTQVFSEFLRYGVPYGVDGLIFGSAQAAGTNIVIFRGQNGCINAGEPADGVAVLQLVEGSVQSHRVMTVVKPSE